MSVFRSAALLMALALLSGCVTDDQNATRFQGAGAGAAVGAGIGALVGGDTEDILLGAAVGSLAGLAVGEVVARKKADYATTEDMIVQERRIITEKADEIAIYNAGLEREIDSLDRDVAALEAALNEGRADHTAKLGLRQRAETGLGRARQRLAEVSQEIEVSRRVYQDAARDGEPVDLVDWDRRIRELERRRDMLAILIGDFETSTQRIV